MTDAHATAILAAVNAQLPGSYTAYEIDDVPATRPDDYVEITVSVRYGGEERSSGHKTTRGYRVTTREVALSVSNARKMRAHTKAALEFQMLTIGSEHTSPIQFESEQPIGQDGGAYSGITAWTYTIKE